MSARVIVLISLAVIGVILWEDRHEIAKRSGPFDDDPDQ